MSKFRYNGYWHTWDRNLCHPAETTGTWGHGPYAEVNLTPINAHQGQKEWDKQVAPIRIRFHGTSPHYGDKFVDELPQEVLDLMTEHLGAELVERLLNEDFLPQIDYEKYKRACNGGANLADILKEGGE